MRPFAFASTACCTACAVVAIAACAGPDRLPVTTGDASAPIPSEPSTFATDPAAIDSTDSAPRLTEPAETDPPTTGPPITDPPATDPPVIDSPCSITGDDNSFRRVPCNEPHDSELAALLTPPDDNIPADPDEARLLFRSLCGPSVEALSARSVTLPGIGVAFSVLGELGGPYESDIECYADITADGALTASMRDVGGVAAFGNYSILADLAPGTCFAFQPNSVDIGTIVSCEQPGSLMAIGSYESADRPYPPLDELRAERSERCAVILAESGLAVDPASVSGSIPEASSWTASGQRLITCDGVALRAE